MADGARTARLVLSAQDDGISLAHVEQHIGDPRNVRWIKLASMVSFGHCSCIDGRDERGVVGTLGGDAGEFLLSLAAALPLRAFALVRRLRRDDTYRKKLRREDERETDEGSRDLAHGSEQILVG